MFLGQCCLESGEFRFMEELGDGVSYEGRRDLGNIEPGDGRKFKGRGVIQLTGRTNYSGFGDSLGVDLLQHPELVAEPELGWRAAKWFWDTHGLDAIADTMDIAAVTKIINGGYNNLEERKLYVNRALAVLGRNAKLGE